MYVSNVIVQYSEGVSLMSKFKTGCLGVIGIVVILGLIGSCAGGGGKDQAKAPAATSSSSSSSAPQAKEKVYNDANVNVLIKEAKENAAAANQNYSKKNVKIIGGKVSNIDSDVKYVSIDGTDANYSMIHIRCDIDSKNKDLKDSVLKLKKGQPVTVYGTITKVGDLIGYSLKLDKIEVAK